MEELIRNFSAEIKRLRLKRGWSQAKLAEKINISQATVCRVEIDCSKVRWIFITKILKLLSNVKFDVVKPTFTLQEDDAINFLEKLKQNDKAWSFISYDAEKAAKIFIKTIEKEF